MEIPDSNFPNSFTDFGDLLKYLRRRARLTQLELSIAVGYSEGQISRLEKNLRLPDLTAVKALFIPVLHLEGEPQLTARFLELAESARQEDAPAPGIAPYKGLLFFDESDSEWFFGRETLTARLAEHVMDLAMDSSSRFLAVVGASGSGKSSLVRAGLAVALKRAGWDTHVFTPTANPMRMLDANLSLARRNNAERVLILVDQFEEVFTLCHDEIERIAFIEKLLSSAQDKSKKATLVVALRADFYSHCAQYPLLRQAVAGEQEYIGQMTFEELRRAIEEPARRGGWEFEPGLVEVLLQDLSMHGSNEPEPGSLPLLSHALLATWEHRRGRTFTLEGYRASGGVRGAIAETAESVFTDQLNQIQQELARDVFLRLTELGEGTEDTRRRAALNELVRQSAEAPQLRAVLNTLAEARLITLNEDSAEVAHEALIREWQRLHEWLTQDREGLLLHRHLTESAQAWEARSRDPAELYRGARLAQAREWATANEERLNAQERAFLAASVEQEQHDALEREAQRQRELEAAQKLAEMEKARAEEQTRSASQLRKRAYYLTGAFLIALIMAVAAIFFGRQSNQHAAQAEQNAQAAMNAQATAVSNADAAQQAEAEAIRQQRLTLSREVAGNAIINLDVDSERSILLAMQAVTTTYAVDGTTTKEAVEALHRAVLNSRLRLTLYPEPGGGNGLALSPSGNALALSPNGERLATSTGDGQIKLWDLNSRQELFALSGHAGVIYSVAFSTDGSRLASSSSDHTAKVWDLDTQQMILDLRGHTAEVMSVDFSQDGNRIVTGSIDGTARVWDAVNGQLLLTFAGHGAPVLSAQFNPDGTRIATAGFDATVRVWDAASGHELYALSDFLIPVIRAAFSPDGKILATNGEEDPRLWDAETGKLLFLLPGFSSGSTQMPVFTPDGKYVAVAGQNGTVSMWETATGLQYLTIATGTPVDGQIEFSPDCVEPPAAPYTWCGTYLVTSNRDGSVRFWDVSPAGNREIMNVPGVWSCLESDGMTLHTAVVEGEGILHFRTRQLPPVSSAVDTSHPLSFALQELSSYSIQFSRIVPDSAFSPDCSRSAVIDFVTRVVTIADTANGKQLLQLKLAEGSPTVFALGASSFSPDGTRFATLGPENTAKVYDLTKGGQELLTLQGHSAPLFHTNFSPDGKQLATTSEDQTIRLWDAETGQELRTFSGHTGPTTGVIFNPEGTRLATGSFDGTAKIWDLETGQELYTLSGPSASVWGIAFSPDGKLIATGSNDLTLRLWDAMTGEELLTLPIPDLSFQLFFTPDQTRLVVQTLSETHVYLLQVEDLIALAKSRVSRTLTIEECQQYLHMQQCPATP